MKKTFIYLVALLAVYGVHAQKGFHLGVSGTFNSTWILNQNNFGTLAPFKFDYVRQSEMDYTKTWGGNTGIVLGYNFHRCWGIQTEVQWNYTGQTYEDNFQGPAYVNGDTLTGRVNVKRKVRLSYLQIPVMAKFVSKKGRVAKFFMCMGPQIGIRLTAYENVKIGGQEYDEHIFTPQQKFKPVDIGLALQLGTEIYITDHLYMDIGLSAYGGLNDLNGKALKELQWYSQNDVNYQKSYNFRAGLMVGIHYIFGEGRIDY